jgi:hypothetical protein
VIYSRNWAGGQVAILGGALLETGQLVAEDDLVLVDHEQSEYADGDFAARDLLGYGAVDADDVRALRNDALECDPDVLECALEFANVSDESRKTKRAPVSLLHVPGTEVAGDRAFIERARREHVSKHPLDQGFVELFLTGGPPCRAFLLMYAHGEMISPQYAFTSKGGLLGWGILPSRERQFQSQELVSRENRLRKK